MMETVGEKISNLPFGKMNLVNELLAYDGMPIVLHYSNERSEDILAYWVDFNNTITRWLYTKISKDELFRYLKGITPLKKIFQEIKSEYVFFADIDQQNNIQDARIVSSYLIPDEYFAGENSYFTEGLSDYYTGYLTEINYHQNLKDRGFMICGTPAKNNTHSTYLTTKEAAFLLTNAGNSTEAYIDITTTNKYRKQYTSEVRIKKVAREIKTHLTPLVTGANIHSFEVLLSIDTITLHDDDKIAREIKSEIVEGFKRDVLDVDFTSAEDAAIICKKFNPSERKKIYGPIINILENEDINVTISDKLKTIRNTGKPIKLTSAFKDLVLPPPSVDELLADKERKKQLYTLIISLNEGTDISKISKREMLDNLLDFGTDIEVPYTIHSPIEANGKSFKLKKPIQATLKIIDNDSLKIVDSLFNLDVKGKDMAVMRLVINQQFFDFVMPYIEGKKEDITTLLLIGEYIDIEKYK